MTKNEFVGSVASKSGLTKKEAATVVSACLQTITESLKAGESVSFTGFGKFSTGKRGARAGINPRSRERIMIPAGTVPKFTAGAALRNAVR